MDKEVCKLAPLKKMEYVENILLKEINGAKQFFTINDLVNRLGFTRETISKHLMILEIKGKVKCQVLRNVKVYEGEIRYKVSYGD